MVVFLCQPCKKKHYPTLEETCLGVLGEYLCALCGTKIFGSDIAQIRTLVKRAEGPSKEDAIVRGRELWKHRAEALANQLARHHNWQETHGKGYKGSPMERLTTRLLGQAVARGQAWRWTKEPPTESGFYWVILPGVPPQVIAMSDDTSIHSIHGKCQTEDFRRAEALWWPYPITHPLY